MEQPIRLGRMEAHHFVESMELSQFAFQFKKTPEQLEKIRERFLTEPADHWGAFAGNRLVAQATVLDLQTYIAGKPFAMGGVAGVATWPEYRRQGLVAKLLTHALEEMRRKGQSLSFLHPFAFGFYRKFGWETYTENKHYTLTTAQLPPRISSEGHMKRISDYTKLDGMYQQYAARYNGTLARTEQWWKQSIAERKSGQAAVYTDAAGNEQGYLIYEVSKMELQVHELVYLNEEARRAIWSFIAQHDSMIERVKLTVPMDDMLTDTLPDPRIKQEVIPYFMARIVDVEALLAQYPFLQGEEEKVRIQVEDVHAPWNSGAYELTFDSAGGCRVARLALEMAQHEGLHLDIGALAMILTGYRSAAQLSVSKRIHGDLNAMNRLQSRIPERTTYLPDFF